MADMIAKAVDLVRFNRICCTFYRKIENEIEIVTFLRQYHWYSIALICPVFPNKNEMCVNYTTKMHPIATHTLFQHKWTSLSVVFLLYISSSTIVSKLYNNAKNIWVKMISKIVHLENCHRVWPFFFTFVSVWISLKSHFFSILIKIISKNSHKQSCQWEIYELFSKLQPDFYLNQRYCFFMLHKFSL